MEAAIELPRTITLSFNKMSTLSTNPSESASTVSAPKRKKLVRIHGCECFHQLDRREHEVAEAVTILLHEE
jgi:hypothetical protein